MSGHTHVVLRDIILSGCLSEIPCRTCQNRATPPCICFAIWKAGSPVTLLKQMYRSFMQRYENLQHMSEVKPHNKEDSNVCYLPHHGVLREASITTKRRVVFNGFLMIPSGESLNNNFLVGQNLLPALADVLLRWRQIRRYSRHREDIAKSWYIPTTGICRGYFGVTLKAK